MSQDVKITAASFDPGTWSLEVTRSDGKVDTWDLTKRDGFGLDGGALKRVEICECGLTISFPDFPPPGAMLTFEFRDSAD